MATDQPASASHPMAKPEDQDAASWLAQATAEYERLTASLSALGSQLQALGGSMQSQQIAASPTPASPPIPAPTQPLPSGDPTLSIHPALSPAGEVDIVSAPVPAPAAEDEWAGTVRVHLLGSFHLSLGDRKLSPSAPAQVQTVLKYLVSQGGRPTSKDALLDLLWPEADPAVTSSRLRVLMHTLRRSVPCNHLGFRDLVLLSGGNFVINPEAKLWVDVDEFEQRWRAGWRLARAGKKVEAMHAYEEAEALYIGDFLEDDPYSDWTLLRREALRDAHTTILTMLASMSLDAGDYTGAIIWAQKLLIQDNCREDAYRILMTSHHRLGQSARAAYWYQLCARTLQRELGIQPSQETQELTARLTEATHFSGR